MIQIIMGSNSPETTNTIMNLQFSIGGEALVKEIETLDENEKLIYSEFFDVVGLSSILTILNIDECIEFSHVTPNPVSLEIVEIDFNVLNEHEKTKINNFINMIKNW